MRIGSTSAPIDLIAQHNLLSALSQLATSSVRLSTMRRINTGADDPAGLTAIESLSAELAATVEASDNAARAAGTVHVADSAMGEVSGLLSTVRANVVAAADSGLSDAERQALQVETDAALDAIDYIGQTTSYGGRKLLDGSGTLSFAFSPDVTDTVTLDLPTVSTSSLGGAAGRLSDLASGGSASLTGGDLTKAMDILDAAGSQVLDARSRAGAFEKYTIDSSQRVLDAMEVNISGAISQIADTDVAQEASRMVRSQILVQTAVSSLMLANQSRGLSAALIGGTMGARS